MHYAQAGFFGSADLSWRGREAFRPNHLAGLTMKRLLVGTAFSVLILLGSAGWAQTPISPGGALGPRPAPAQPTHRSEAIHKYAAGYPGAGVQLGS